MIVDTSAIVAILLDEPGRFELYRKLSDATVGNLSAVSYMETGMVPTSHFGGYPEISLDRLQFASGIDVIPVTPLHAKPAREAFRQYGRGRHPAPLNFGDCFSYALAQSSAQPLLFKGSDFVKTGIHPA